MSWEQDGSGYGIFLQRYDASGVAQGSETRVNTTTTDYQYAPAVAGLDGGGYVVTWMSSGQDGSTWGIYSQRYDESGVAQGSETQVNTSAVGEQEAPAVAALDGGGYVVTWMSYGQDGSMWGIYAQRYDALGVAQGGEVQVNSTTVGSQEYPSITGLAGGGYVITWMSYGQDGSEYGVYAQAYDSSGLARGSETLVNTITAGAQEVSSVAGLADGRFVVAWQSFNQDGSGYGIFAQQFAAQFVNAEPAGADGTITVNEDQSHVFGSAEFPFTDSDGGTLAAVVFTTLPALGVLHYDNGVDPAVDLAAGDVVSAADIVAGYLTYVPPADQNGAGYATFTFQVRDDGGTANGGQDTDQSANTMTIDVAAVNDAPSGAVTIDGLPVIGTTLTAVSTLADPDGLGTFTYQWYRNGSPIDGATASTYSLTTSDYYYRLTVRVSYLDGGGNTETVLSAATTPAGDLASGTGPVITIQPHPSMGFVPIYVTEANFGDGDALTVQLDSRYAEAGYGVQIYASSVTRDGLSLIGGDGQNTLFGGAGADTLTGGHSNDSFEGGAGNDLIVGAAGSDTAYFSGSLADYSITQDGDTTYVTGPDGADQLVGVNSLVFDDQVFAVIAQPVTFPGTANPDTFTGGDSDDSITGLGGDDVLDGGDGNDVISGGDGNDLLDGGRGNDTIEGGAGNDRLTGGEGDDTLDGGEGDDLLVAGQDNSGSATRGVITALGGGGNDRIFGPLLDNVDAGAGNDWVMMGYSLSRQPTLIDGGSGIDTLTINSNHTAFQTGAIPFDFSTAVNFEQWNLSVLVSAVVRDVNFGSTGQLLINADSFLSYGIRVDASLVTAGTLDIRAGSGDDVLIGGALDDTLSGGGGNDTLTGGDGIDTASYSGAASGVTVSLLIAGAQNTGGDGTDTLTDIENLTGSAFADVLTGNSGVNTLTGLAGNDLLDGRDGADTMIGGTGNDTYYVNHADDVVVDVAGEGEDRVLTRTGYTLAAGVSVEIFAAVNSRSITPMDLTGNEFGQRIVGNGANNTLTGLGGNDDLNGLGGVNVLIGGTGNDIYRVNTGDIITELAGEGDDTVRASTSYTLAAGVSVEALITKNGNSTTAMDLTGNEFNQTIYGNAGVNVLNGAGGGDYLLGAGGNDTLIGGTGGDAMAGGAGNDTFVFAATADSLVADPDRILDFATGDLIDLAGIDADSGLVDDQAFSFVGSSAFTNTAGELRAFQNPSGTWIVQGDVNGDGVADFQIQVTSATPLTVDSFVL